MLRKGRKIVRAWRESDLEHFLNTAWRRYVRNQKPGGLTRTYWTRNATVPLLRAEYDNLILFLATQGLIVGRQGKASGRLIGPPTYCLDMLRKEFGHV
jgi:hypothetical protein